MSEEQQRFSIPARVALGVICWAVLLLLVWAVRPVDDVATFAPVENPSPTEQRSIDAVLGDLDGPQPKLFEQVTCDSSPLGVATGGARSVEAPELDAGFEYVDPPCSDAYDAATAAFWVNAAAIVAVLAACLVLHLRTGRRRREPAPDSTSAPDALLLD